MLKRKYRLPSGFRFANFSTYTSQYLKLMVTRNNLAINRLGFVISKKTEKMAVNRNTAKRLVRSCVEEMLEKISGGYDMLFIIRNKISPKSREIISGEAQQLLKQAKLLK